MNNNELSKIGKKDFDAFVHAIGSEIEQAQVWLISAANAQMLFHYWKVGNFILYHQSLQGWGGKVIKAGTGNTVQLPRKERVFGTQPYLYVPIRKVVSIERTTKFY